MPLPADLDANGYLYSHVSDDVRIFGLRLKGNTEITHSVEIEDADEYGSSETPVGSTRGRVKYTLSFTLLLGLWDAYCADCLSKGFRPMRRPGVMTWVIAETGKPTITYAAQINKLTKVEVASEDGPGATKAKIEAKVLKITRNGVPLA
jgi:hypothetical protein